MTVPQVSLGDRMDDSFDVAIVGGGPVGVALAVELGQRRISCVLVERHLAPQPIPKGQNLTNRTLEHFYFWRCVNELRAARVMPAEGGLTASRWCPSPPRAPLSTATSPLASLSRRN